MKHFFDFVDNWLRTLLFFSFVWAFCSFMGSALKASNENCGKVYGADKVLYADLFCEVKK
jgi:hypothetical protein